MNTALITTFADMKMIRIDVTVSTNHLVFNELFHGWLNSARHIQITRKDRSVHYAITLKDSWCDEQYGLVVAQQLVRLGFSVELILLPPDVL